MQINRYQRQILRQSALKKQTTYGKNRYLFENNTQGDLFLPRPTHEGIRKIGAKNDKNPGISQFIGDDYYLCLVPSDLKLIKFIETIKDEDSMATEETLITEQPPVVQSKKENVKNAQPPIKEESPSNDEEMLLTENPLDGIEVI